MNVISRWFKHHLADPQVVILSVILIIGFLGVLMLGHMLAPVLASAVLAYLLEGLVGFLERHKVPRLLAVMIVFLTFTAALLFLFFGLMPLIWQQIRQLTQELPAMISWAQKELMRLPERFPGFMSEQQVIALSNALRSEITFLGQRILSLSVASLRSFFTILVYIFLMPLLVFFFLKDKNRILKWVGGFLPEERGMATEVWHEVDLQIGNYIRGKCWEIIIVWSASFLTFMLLDLQYAMLVSLFVGLSVLIPYFGAIFMVLPVASIAFFQWGWSTHLAYVVGAYTMLQILDGNVLVALLFSEAVNLHPVAIIVAVLVFGGTLGFWGVFFAIPLATLVQAIIKAWARNRKRQKDEDAKQNPQGQEA